jgi:hypothetical protein
VFNSSADIRHDLECLRLASDLMQMSRDTLNAKLQAHCIRMAKYWSGQAVREPNQSIAIPMGRRLS